MLMIRHVNERLEKANRQAQNPAAHGKSFMRPAWSAKRLVYLGQSFLTPKPAQAYSHSEDVISKNERWV
jgi:hypothetical protein